MPNKKEPSHWLPLTVTVFGVAAAICCVVLLRDQVERRYAWPMTGARVELVDRPAWMSTALADQILDTARPIGIRSVYDRQLLIDTAAALQRNPWIKQVRQVRRAFVHNPGDTLEVNCIYRVPTALVQWQGYYWLVDGDGFKLPEQYTRQQLRQAMYDGNGHLALRIIQGVTRQPVASGRLWPGDDLAAGLEMTKLLAGHNFADELPIVDVCNFRGREDPQAAQIVLITSRNTVIRWGRPPSAKDYFVEVPTSQKLQCLSDIFQQMHHVDGGQPWIDIRFDQVLYPSPVAASSSE
jgi:hypothetical protein